MLRESTKGNQLAAMCDRHDTIARDCWRLLKRGGLLGVVESIGVSAFSPVAHEVMLVIGFHGVESTMEVFSSEEDASWQVLKAVLWYLGQRPHPARSKPTGGVSGHWTMARTGARSGPALGRMGASRAHRPRGPLFCLPCGP